MNIIRRLSAVAICGSLASMFASAAPVITFGTDPFTGNHTVTQTVSFTSATSTTTALGTFAGFTALGLNPLDIYVNGDSTLDYQFTNNVSQFSVTNHDATSDTVNFGLVGNITLDVGNTLVNAPAHDLKNVCIGLTGTTTCTQTENLISITNQTIAGGATYTDNAVPVNITEGICLGNLGTFGTVNAGGANACAQLLGNDSAYNGAANVAFGIDNAGNYTFSAVGSSNTNLQFQSTVNFTGMAEITYEYVVSSGTPEPTTMVLFGSALVGLGLLRKRARG